MLKEICKTCNNEFIIRDEDLVFYEQMKTASPLYCPECRMARRLMFRNERILYKRPCDLCKKDMVTLYSPESPFTVYCSKCWWSDNWNPKDYGADYDPNKKFFDQYKELQMKVPRLGIIEVQNVRSEYTNGSAENKDCYLIFASDFNEDCLYGRLVQRSKQSMDGAFLHDSEFCYECIDCRKCFKCLYSEQCQDSTDLLFCYNLRNSNNCIFCTNGRNLSNAIYNKKYSKEEFEQKKKEILNNYETIEEAKKQFEELKNKTIKKFAAQTKCHNVTGDYLHNCQDGVRLFDTYDAKNCSYMKDIDGAIDSMDCNNAYDKPEFAYNVMGALQGSKLKNSAFVFYSNEVEYCDNCHHLLNGIGCISIRKGNYMIFNKEYSKDEYLKLKIEIEEQLKKEGVFGQFFPPEVAPFAYNESLIQDFFPLSREEAVKRGYRWQDRTTGTFGKETIKKGEIPNNINDVDDGILDEILICEDCNKNYKIVKAELDFYKRMGLPLPHKDFECRHKDRMSKRNPMKLWHRKCMKEGCSNEFETTYSPERPEVIYCESCYQQEVY
ncbi:MAG TPA: hypothetical protein VK153_03665 [Candidatus Paceibacterota bacterium]|nr:hypothetical protein [Candidatus Paceibacterota bacterium]